MESLISNTGRLTLMFDKTLFMVTRLDNYKPFAGVIMGALVLTKVKIIGVEYFQCCPSIVNAVIFTIILILIQRANGCIPLKY